MSGRGQISGRSRIGMTALGRLHLRVETDGVVEDVILERRWPDAASARDWCERMVAEPAGVVALQEAHVFTEAWRHPRSWETEPVRAVAQSDQVGAPDTRGGICWGRPAAMADRREGRPERVTRFR